MSRPEHRDEGGPVQPAHAEIFVGFINSYADKVRAESYARLEFANTYYLAYRDLPEITGKHVRGTRAIDFGCGTGRSTRFARQLGFDVIGVDVAAEMISIARKLDPGGDYRLIKDGNFGDLPISTFDLVLSLFTFDNIPGLETKVRLLRGLKALLNDSGKLVSVVSSPEIYLHEWASFSTAAFPENRFARSGDVVRIVTTDFEDRRPTEDILCTDESYRDAYSRAGLKVVATYQPLANGEEPYPWVNETRIAPWTIYVLSGA